MLLILAQLCVFLSLKRPEPVELSSVLPAVSSAAPLKPAGYTFLSGLLPSPRAALLVSLALIPVVTRCCAGLAVSVLKPMPTSQYAGMDAASGEKHIAFLSVLLAIFTVVPVVLFGAVALSPLAAGIFYWLFAAVAYKNLDGMNGDISGYALTLGELFGTAALVIISTALMPIIAV